MKPVASALILTVIATPLAAFTPERAAMMVDAVRAQDCTLNGSQAEAIFAPLGLDPMEVQSFVDILFASGLVEISGNGEQLTLSPGLCAADAEGSLARVSAAFAQEESTLTPWRPEVSPEQGALMVGALRGNNCVMSDEDAARLLPDLGFTPSSARDVAAVLVSGELASIGAEDGVFALSEAFCAADPAGDVAALTEIIDNWGSEAEAEAQTPAEVTE